MAKSSQAPGCRETTLATLFLVVTALVFLAVGLTLLNQANCHQACSTLGETLYAAGLPLSAALALVFGDLVVAWPLDITLWVVAGFAVATWSAKRSSSAAFISVLVTVAALIYGLVISLFVEIGI